MGKASKPVLIVLALVTTFSLVLATSHAELGDLSAAELSNVQDIAAATAQSVQGNVTCRPDAFGGDITQHTNIVVGDVFPHDFAAGNGVCDSLTLEKYTATLYVDVEYYDAGLHLWRAVGGSIVSESGSSVEGALELKPLVSNVTYTTFPNTYLNRYHRGHAEIVTSFGKRYDDYTPAIWYMKP